MNRVPFWDVIIDEYSACYSVSDGFFMEGEHAHQHMEFLFNFSPIPIRRTVNGHAHETDVPCMTYRAPYILHSGSTVYPSNPEGYHRYALNVHPCILSEYGGICDMGQLRSRTDCLIPLGEEQICRIRPILDMLQTDRPDTLPRHAWIGMFAALLTEINRLLPLSLQDGSDNRSVMYPYIQELLQYVVDNVGEDLRASTLATKFFVSRAKLCADFRAATRITLHEYVTATRIARAKRWLLEDMPLSMIALRCGFSQESSFIYMFRQEVGMTPMEWMKQQK